MLMNRKIMNISLIYRLVKLILPNLISIINWFNTDYNKSWTWSSQLLFLKRFERGLHQSVSKSCQLYIFKKKNDLLRAKSQQQNFTELSTFVNYESMRRQIMIVLFILSVMMLKLWLRQSVTLSVSYFVT